MGMGRQSAPAAAVPVLLTRPIAEAQAFAMALTRRFGPRVQPVLAPLMATDHLMPALPPGPFAGVIFTSAAAVEAALRLAADLPKDAWCVGRKTADRATAAGFRARSADGDADALVAAILADPPKGKLLHLRGEDVRGEVAERLNSAGSETVSATLYRQTAQPLSPEGAAVLVTAGPVILPLFSPRSAALFRAVLPVDSHATLGLVAMSGAVADAARPIPHHVMITAAQPTAKAMLDACGKALEMASLP
jgi:uroporphyrinogen-III synthase